MERAIHPCSSFFKLCRTSWYFDVSHNIIMKKVVWSATWYYFANISHKIAEVWVGGFKAWQTVKARAGNQWVTAWYSPSRPVKIIIRTNLNKDICRYLNIFTENPVIYNFQKYDFDRIKSRFDPEVECGGRN